MELRRLRSDLRRLQFTVMQVDRAWLPTTLDASIDRLKIFSRKYCLSIYLSSSLRNVSILFTINFITLDYRSFTPMAGIPNKTS